MVTLASPRNGDGCMPDVLPTLRPPIGLPSGKLTPRLPRSSGTSPSANGGLTPTPAPLPAPIAPGPPLIGPGKSIASVLRALPPSGLGSTPHVGSAVVCYGPDESASWPETRWRREKNMSYDEGRGTATVSPRQRLRAPCPPADEPPASGARRPGRRASSEGVSSSSSARSSHIGSAHEKGKSCLSARRGNAEHAERGGQKVQNSLAPASTLAHPPPRPTRRTPREGPHSAEVEEHRTPQKCNKAESNSPCGSLPCIRADSSSPRRTRASSRQGSTGLGSSDGVASATSQPGDASPRASSQQRTERQVMEMGPRSNERTLEQIEYAGSARKQAREWFKMFLIEAENEVQAAEAAKAAAASAPSAPEKSAKSMIEEFDQERKMWEERTRNMLLGEAAHGEIEIQCERPSSSERNDRGNISSSGAEQRLETAAEAEGLDDGDQGGQIAAALREAGLDPGSAAVREFTVVAESSDVEETSNVEDGAAQKRHSCRPMSADTDTGPSVDDANHSGGKARWAVPARQWAAERLRRKREKALHSRSGTPCNAEHCASPPPLFHSGSQASD